MAWLSITAVGGTNRHPNQPETDTVGYWIQRFLPLVELEHPVAVVTCNRVGQEDNLLFTGSSAAFTFEGKRNPTNPVKIAGALPCDQPAVRVFEMEVAETYETQEK